MAKNKKTYYVVDVWVPYEGGVKVMVFATKRAAQGCFDREVRLAKNQNLDVRLFAVAPGADAYDSEPLIASYAE